MTHDADITILLEAARGGDRVALDNVLATLYRELHDTTALVHESYFKLIRSQHAEFADRAHFFAYAATAMRSVVVDYARQRLSQKRGGDQQRVTEFPEDGSAGVSIGEDMLHLDSALQKLSEVDKRLPEDSPLRGTAALANARLQAETARALEELLVEKGVVRRDDGHRGTVDAR